jgi:sugar phosphate isomerase/epimerase
MLVPGLVSITFRKLSPAEVVRAAVEAGLRGIEWGGDVHVPHGDIAAAERAAEMTRGSGMRVSAYGSYYRLGENDPDLPFERVRDTAAALGTSTIRVWAGRTASADADEAYRQRVAEDLHRAAELSDELNQNIALEWHGNTLTDTAASAEKLLREVDRPNVGCMWQPRNDQDLSLNLTDMETALPRLMGIHVFHWEGPNNDRRPLSEGESRWHDYFAKLIDSTAGRKVFASLEFVKGDDPEQLKHDASVLIRHLELVNP